MSATNHEMIDGGGMDIRKHVSTGSLSPCSTRYSTGFDRETLPARYSVEMKVSTTSAKTLPANWGGALPCAKSAYGIQQGLAVVLNHTVAL